ncbi:MAG: hypothetical protein JXA69_02065 [Phycisphaerae bacterium]|nr:hypothetical protein [Phycisphaerae bacterium]
MDPLNRLETLLTLADAIGIEIRRTPLGGEGGGLCALRGRRVLFVDTAADVATQYEKTVAALAGLSEVQDRFLPPEVRDDLDNAANAT